MMEKNMFGNVEVNYKGEYAEICEKYIAVFGNKFNYEVKPIWNMEKFTAKLEVFINVEEIAHVAKLEGFKVNASVLKGLIKECETVCKTYYIENV